MANDMAAAWSPENGRSHREIENAAGRGLLLNQLPEILEAARNGQVARLHVCPDDPVFAVEAGMLNSAVLSVLAHRGTISTGIDSGVSAVLRYRPATVPAPEPVSAA